MGAKVGGHFANGYTHIFLAHQQDSPVLSRFLILLSIIGRSESHSKVIFFLFSSVLLASFHFKHITQQQLTNNPNKMLIKCREKRNFIHFRLRGVCKSNLYHAQGRRKCKILIVYSSCFLLERLINRSGITVRTVLYVCTSEV